jgi:hypothetical protein
VARVVDLATELLHPGGRDAAHDHHSGACQWRRGAPARQKCRCRLFDKRKVGQHKDNHGQIAHADNVRRPPAAQRFEFRDGATRPVPQHEVPAILEQVGSHGLAHQPQPYKASYFVVHGCCHLTSLWLMKGNLFNILAAIQYDEHYDV